MPTEPSIESLREELKQTQAELKKYKTWMPPGHYYSPIPDKADIANRKDSIYKRHSEFLGIDFNHQGQVELLEKLKHYYSEIPFQFEQSENRRYFYNNNFFGYGDSTSLYSMLRHFEPRHVIEVGSGFSSAVMLDVNEKFLNNETQLTFIEPYTKRLRSLLKTDDNATIHESGVQEIDLTVFDRLGDNDFLFIDSTHVSKIGSDVNYLFFEVLPRLKKGVIIHIHDIAANFEYPFKWIEEGRAWNESYLLRAFLQFNEQFQIILFNSYLGKVHKKWLEENMPVFLKNSGGSIWLRRN
jgi:predicted O-methyltransferase YrrM